MCQGGCQLFSETVYKYQSKVCQELCQEVVCKFVCQRVCAEHTVDNDEPTKATQSQRAISAAIISISCECPSSIPPRSSSLLEIESGLFDRDFDCGRDWVFGGDVDSTANLSSSPRKGRFKCC